MYHGNSVNHDPECSILLRKIPKELRRRFKGWCANRGETMTSVLRQFMYNCVTGEQRRLEQRTKRRKHK